MSTAGPIEIVRDDEESPNQDEGSKTSPRKQGSDRILREQAWRSVDAHDVPPPQVMSTLLSQCFDDETEKAKNIKAIKSRFKRCISHKDVIYNEKKKTWMISPDSSLLPKTDGNEPSSKVIEGFRPLRLVKENKANSTIASSAAPVDSPQDQAKRAKSRRKQKKLKAQSDNPKGSTSHAQESERSNTDKDSDRNEESSHEATVAKKEEHPLPEEVDALAADGLYAVEDILDDRLVVVKGKSSSSEYLIKWKGYGMDECTWEPKSSVMDPCLVERYEVNKIYDKLSRLEPKEQDAKTMLSHSSSQEWAAETRGTARPGSCSMARNAQR